MPQYREQRKKIVKIRLAFTSTNIVAPKVKLQFCFDIIKWHAQIQ